MKCACVIICVVAAAVGCQRLPYPESVVSDEQDIAVRLVRLGAEVRTDDAGQVACVKFYFNPNLENPLVGDDDIECLINLPKLQKLMLGRTQVSDAAFRKVVPLLGELKSLEVPDGLTDHGLRAVEGLSSLRSLSVYEGKITDDGLESLSGLTELRELSLAGCPIQGPGLKHLSSLQKLESLNLSSTKVRFDGLVAINELPSLRSISLSGTNLTDEGILAIRPTLMKIERLHLGGTQITDAGIQSLSGLPSLRVLWLGGVESDLDDTEVRRLIPSLKEFRRM